MDSFDGGECHPSSLADDAETNSFVAFITKRDREDQNRFSRPATAVTMELASQARRMVMNAPFE
jgi:hypothetical protein